jgi:hypothetical protein
MALIGTLKTIADSDIADVAENLSNAELSLLDGVTAGTVTASKALTADSSGRISGLSLDQQARTATSAGTGTGTITATGQFVHVPVTASDATHIVVLPAPTPGRVVMLTVGANGYELRSSAPATVGIGGGTGSSAESAIAANTVAVLYCISATSWVGFTITGATHAAVEAAV